MPMSAQSHFQAWFAVDETRLLVEALRKLAGGSSSREVMQQALAQFTQSTYQTPASIDQP